jgi:hypothetical protein
MLFYFMKFFTPTFSIEPFDKGANHVPDEKEADPKDKCQTS